MVKARKKQHSNQFNKLFQTFLFTYVTFICVASYKSLSWLIFLGLFLTLSFGVNNSIQENRWQN